MELLKAKKKDLLAFLTSLIQAQTGAVPTLKPAGDNCERQVLGKWITNCDFPLLIDTLALGEAVFTTEFPGVQLTMKERQEVADELQSHCESCKECQAKRASDLAWKARMERVFSENQEVVRNVLARAVGRK